MITSFLLSNPEVMALIMAMIGTGVLACCIRVIALEIELKKLTKDHEHPDGR